MTSVVVMVATFRRPVWLGQLLESLVPEVAAWRVAHGEARVVVVDNDPLGSARGVVEGFEGVGYVIESEPGISAARNRCLAEALRVGPDLLAFVDDDETVQPGWLAAHVGALEGFGADASFGPVPPVYDEGVPGWVRRLGFFERPSYETGLLARHPATNNTVFRASLLDALEGVFFDASYGLTGGEDVDFFRRAAAAGAVFVWCDGAVATEHVPRERANARWLWRRWRRIGISVRDQRAAVGTSDLRILASGACRVAVGLLGLAGAMLTGWRAAGQRQPVGHRLTQIVMNLGMVEGALGRRIVEYGRSAPEVSL